MEIESINFAFGRLHSASNIQATYWALYATITLAIITFLGSQWGKQRPIQMFIFLFVGFLIFSGFNCYEIYGWQVTIENVCILIERFGVGNKEKLGPLIFPLTQGLILPPVYMVILIHVFFDIVVLSIIVFAYQKSQQTNK